MTTLALPLPVLTKGRFASLDAYSDDALYETTGVRIAFTTRHGGVRTGSYDSLNLGSHVDDTYETVQENRMRVIHTLASRELPLVVPTQVHGDTVLSVDDAHFLTEVQREAHEGADALIVDVPDVAALLCFADCVPVIAVLPTGRFAVIHAGWRGVENGITAKTIRLMVEAEMQNGALDGDVLHCELMAGCNVYIGPYIHQECFETGAEVHQRFIDRFGESCVFDASHINLAQALRVQLCEIGIDTRRVCDLDKCTVCCNDEFFSYRAQDGIAGRHGALAFRVSRV